MSQKSAEIVKTGFLPIASKLNSIKNIFSNDFLFIKVQGKSLHKYLKQTFFAIIRFMVTFKGGLSDRMT